ncbi:DUF2490 domain-containing protein [Larkinella sp. VNQ87]|uniref:DUF2490 domain-containing protein n=1 Tax=Larkinella sp. VNQ87 TaxID=3400921 RepID=UPI003C043F58
MQKQATPISSSLRKVGWSILVSLLVAHTGMTQSNRVLEHHRIGWFVYNGDHKISQHWAIHTEYQWRRINFIRTWQQSLARVGVTYERNAQLAVSAGYTYFVTFPYGEYPVADAGVPTSEHRAYEDVQLSDQVGRVGLTHRFRLEQRWLSVGAEDNPRRIVDWEFQNRVRYQLAGEVPLNGATIDDGEVYLTFFDELFISFGRNVGLNVFNQNRLSGGLGYQIQDNLKLELNYLNQISQHPEAEPRSGKPVFEINNGFRLNVSWDLDFTGK